MMRPHSTLTGLLVALLMATGLHAADQPGPLFDSGARVTEANDQVRVHWPISATSTGVAVFNLDASKPLIASLGAGADGEPARDILTETASPPRWTLPSASPRTKAKRK